ncbi:hypothetical protein ABFS82_13G071700 [Erythranthe guttata]|uniref:arginine/serine-rich protein PNISR n=1 Tax=Erythranthe guttata TaxID=4155 RepID=UPI00064DC9CA|nr:PREDICTED: arginine/serine-rich protein PNISR [Erythranthe guttata]|eukprot:XP_012847873.1 PREDICTED: arginine/serine-rich protein PNISR [Erythranthe guttata]
MADKGSASKSKSSKRKRDKTSSKKKSRRKESKKSRRIHDSPSSHSDHDSLISEHSSSSIDDKRRINKNKKRARDYSDYSSDSDSLSDRENGVKRRKVRDSRVSSKSTKKRDRKRSVSPKAVVRKKKRLDKDRSVKSIKKSSKKKPKKYSSSDSESSGDGKNRRSRIVTDKEERGRESTYKMSKVRSPSSSSISGRSDRAFSPVVNNTRRLRSVITVVVHQPDDEGGNRWEGDPQKEEIFYDKNDYPSPKSVDSNNACGEEVTDPIKSRIDETNNLEKEKVSDESAPVVAALGADVLEAILRQKALENLKKFKGRLQTGPKKTELKINNETDLNKPTELVSGPTLKEDVSRPREVVKFVDSELIEKEAVIDEQTPIGAEVVRCSEEDKCSNSRAVLAEEFVLTNDDNNPANPSSSSSSARLMSDEHGLEQNDEAKDGSQFKKKTMSVVRGGEVVQVSYKVYIPKKAPALGRRQFKR